MPAAAMKPRAGAAVTWAPYKAGQLGVKAMHHSKTHTRALLVLVVASEPSVASEAWLDRAVLSAPPVMLDTKVVVPIVVSEPLSSVETISEVTVVSGIEVAPATPLTPEMVVSPVMVLVKVSLLMTEVQVLVVMAVASPSSLELSSEPDTVDTEVVTKVESPLVTVVTISDVVTGLAEALSPEPWNQVSANCT